MKENSIEEDIKNLNEIIELSKEEIDAKDENITAILDIEDLISLEHILSNYKRVLEINEVLLKENEELKNQEATQRKINELLVQRYSNSIPIKKVKEIIKELEDNIYRIKKQYSNGGENCNTVYLENLAQIKILKQILKEVE